MASVQKVNQWRNIPTLTQPMDLAVPKLAQLQDSQSKFFTHELEQFCLFLEQHPLAKKHKKNLSALTQHMRMNINEYLKGHPLHH